MISRHLTTLFYRLIPSGRERETAAPSPDETTTEALLHSALRVAGLGCWTWNVAAGEIRLSPEAEKILGQPGLDGTFESWLQFVDPADAGALQEVEDQVRNGQRTFSFEYGFRRGDGVLQRLKSDGEVVARDEHGSPLTLAGTVLALGNANEPHAPRAGSVDPLPSTGEAASTWTWEQDASYRFTSVKGGNRKPVPELAGVVGRQRWELPHAVPLNSSWQEHLRTLERHEPFRGFEYRIGQGPGAACVSINGDPVFGPAGDFQGYRGTAHNITRRVRAEEAATHARLLLQQASRLGQLGAWALRVPGMEAEWTHESQQLFGHGGGTPLSWHQALANIEEPYRSQLQQAVADCVAQGRSFALDARAHSAGPQVKWLRIIGEPEPSLTGACRRVIGAVQDISEKKGDARRLQELSDRFITTLESITSGFYTLDREWRFTYANHETERVSQRSREQLLGRSIIEVFEWFEGSRFHREFQRALADGQPTHFEAVSHALDLWMEVNAYPSCQGLAVYFQDITERKKAQDALRASEERHRLLIEMSIDAILQLEQESGRIVSANPAACQMFGLTEAQMQQRGRKGLVAAGEQRLESILAEAKKTGKTRGHLKLVRGDGSAFEAEISGALFTASDGIVYASVAIRDVSELLKYQAEILALNESLAHKVRERTAELVAANAELTAFAHSLAHDLRTPIAAIHALAHVLEQRLDTGAERERGYAGRIRLAAQQLDEYVEALLSHARISQAPLRASRIDLSATAEGILADLRLREPGRTVATQVQPGLAAVGDPALLRMALENLLGNAWKFTGNRADAEIRFSAQTQEDGSTTFCVSDNGAGFDMEYAHKLFGSFQRLHTQAEFPGTGIGLANVHRIVARHGGRIWTMAQPGAGASFYFTLPRHPGSAEGA